MDILFVLLLGLVFGSFIAALTYRLPRNISIIRGRSYCPKCKRKISGFDNIPLLSFLLLRGRCRNCGGKISFRYPIIEATTAFLFVMFYVNLPAVWENISWLDGNYLILFVGSMIVIFFSIFVIDLEHQIVPDSLVFVGISLFLLISILSGANLFLHLLSGFVAASALLLIHILTRGRGMGLGDVKLAILIGAIFGYPLGLLWIFLSFMIGGLVAGLMVISRRATIAARIAFGPFLVAASFIVMIWGKIISNGLF